MQKILLTGEIQVGKSTIINRVCADLGNVVKGFHTIAIRKDSTEIDSLYILPYIINVPSCDDKPIAIRNMKLREKKAFPEIFDKHGVKILNEAKTNPNTKLLIMDELGFFENDAILFQNEIISCLSGDIPVLGVIKPKRTDFLDKIRSLPDVKIIEVTEENRDKIYEEVLTQINEML